MSDFAHKALISNLSAQERQALLAQDDFHGLRQFGLHAGANRLRRRIDRY